MPDARIRMRLFGWRNARTVQLREALRSVVALAARPTFELPAAQDSTAPPTEMRLLASGVNRTQKGDFLFDDQAASDVIAFWQENGVDLTFDYEHQALVDPPIQAPAACYRWVPEIRNGELWATSMCWTSKASNYITAKEYRYWSPALLFDDDTMRVKAILNCALTNLPATKDIAPLVAASVTAKENEMDLEKLVAELRAQLAAKTGECETLTARLSAMGDSKEEETAVCSAVGLRAGASRLERLGGVTALATLRRSLHEATAKGTDAEALGTINAWKSEAGQVAALKAEHAARAETEAAADMEAAFEEGVKTGKLPKSPDHPMRASLKTAVLNWGGGKPSKDGVAWLRADIAARSQFVTVAATAGNDGGAGGPVGLTESEKANMTALGMSLEIAAKAKAHIEAQRAARRA